MMMTKVTDSLLNYLNTGDEVDRCYAAKTLGNLRIESATPALLERLRDEDIDVCIDAITALGKICDPSALPLLLESLEKDPDCDVKLAITESLANFKNATTIETLIKLVEDRPEEMDFDENKDWDDWWDLQQKAIIILGEMKVEEAFPILRTTLEDEFSQDIEAIILKSIAKISGEEADDYLISLLKGEEPKGQSENSQSKSSVSRERSQRRVATALGFSESKKTLDALGRALLSKSADTRENAIYALGKRKASQYIEAILMTLRNSNTSGTSNVKRAALEVIQDLASDEEINTKLDFNQITMLLETGALERGENKLTKEDIALQVVVLSFLYKQQKTSPIFNQLNEESKQLIRQSLKSRDDKVIIQATQLLGLSGDLQSLDTMLSIASSEANSVWLRKEAILSLSDSLINSSNKTESEEITEIKQRVLSQLKLLIKNNEQTIRFASAQSLLKLSNYYGISTHVSDTQELPPIAILLATIKGEQVELKDQEIHKEVTQESDCNTCAKSADCSSSPEKGTEQVILEQFADKNIDESERLITANEDQSLQAPMSTLEAITMDNVENTFSKPVETDEQKAHDYSTGPYISEDLPEEMDEFVNIMRKNFDTAKKIVRKKVDTHSDARHICTRLLADNNNDENNELIVNVLAECLNDDDEVLRQEAAESISQISLKNPQIPGLSNTFGKLVTLLDSKNSDMRISCIRAISHSGNRASLPHLLDYLSDEDYLVKLEVIHGLSYILNNKANLSEEQLEAYMDLAEVSNEAIIEALFDCLDDSNYSISMAAIEVLIELKQTHAIEQFIDVALKGEGQSAKRISKLLRSLDAQQSTELLLARLDAVEHSSSRRYVMEMLETVVA